MNRDLCRKPAQLDVADGVDVKLKHLSDDDKLVQVISVQNFDGSFQLAPTFAELLESTVEELKTSKISCTLLELRDCYRVT